ncbi:MAG: ABC transporter permease [Angustibacter sp.]
MTGREGRSPSQIAWGRLRRDRVGMISLGVVVTVVLVVILTPVIVRILGLSPEYDTTRIGDGGLPKENLGWSRIAISWDHPLGIEPVTGRDILAELLYGARVSLVIAVTGALLTTILGTVFGLLAGYLGGAADAVIGRVMDLLLSFPQLILLLALSPIVLQLLQEKVGLEGAVVPRVVFLIAVFTTFGWPYLARIIRGQVLSLREREFVEAAVSMGASTRRIVFREMLPNLWVPILVYFSLLMPTYIASEAVLAFLGVGVGEPTPTWGKMLAESVSFSSVAPLYLFIPGTALFVVVLAFNLLGDSVRDALDPRASRT